MSYFMYGYWAFVALGYTPGEADLIMNGAYYDRETGAVAWYRGVSC